MFVVGLGFIFAFAKIEGRNLLTVLTNFFTFSISSKLYVWQKTRIKPKIALKKEKITVEKEEVDKVSSLKISKKSKLRDLSTQIETRTR